MAGKTTPPKTPALQEVLRRLTELEDRFNPNKAYAAELSKNNMVQEVRPIKIPVTLQTSDDSQVINLEVPLYELEHQVPQAVHNFLEICRMVTGPHGRGIESVVIQVSFKSEEKKEN